MDPARLGDAMVNGDSLPFDDEKQTAVFAELKKIIESEAFRTSKRSRQFLTYVVQQTLEGRGSLLKERTIGVDVFDRSPEDITPENSVVRKQAGELRRRLDQYYKDVKDLPDDSPIRILLPLGSYVPEFCFCPVHPSDSEASSPPFEEEAVRTTRTEGKPADPARHIHLWIPAVAALLLAALCIGLWAYRRQNATYPQFTRFWEPVTASPESVVVCLAKPVVYLPSREFYRRYSDSHGHNFGLEWQRLNERLPKDLDMAPSWADMQVQEDYGIARGDAEAAFRIATLFGRLGKSSQLRIGEDCSLADLRSAPVTLIGAYNNRWTIEMMSTLHFKFSEDRGLTYIQEQAPSGRVWKAEWKASERSSQWGSANEQQPATDYAIVSRLKSSQTGQYLTIVAGLTGPGTQAAAEFVSTPAALDQALQQISPSWENRNLQMVLRVPVPNGITPTTPQVVATYSW
jgi:hypothetical protein